MSVDEQQPIRIVVEVVSSADVKRLEDRDDKIKDYVKSLEDRIEGLHRTVYELMEVLSKFRSKQ